MHTCTKRNSKKNKKTKNDGGILVSQFGMHVVILIIMPVIIRFFVYSGQTSGDALYISKQQSSSIIWLPDTDPDVVVTCAYQTCAQLIVTSLTNMADWNRGNIFFDTYSLVNVQPCAVSNSTEPMFQPGDEVCDMSTGQPGGARAARLCDVSLDSANRLTI